MKKILLFTFCLLGYLTNSHAQAILESFGDARSGTSGFQFVKISVDARSSALGNSSVADAFDASSLYWNPALAVQIGENQVMASYTSYFVDIQQGYMSGVYQLDKLNIALGVSLQYLDSGEMLETDEFNQFGTGRTFRTSHYTLGLSASQRLTDLFSYGLTLRYLNESIENVTMQTGTLDLGFFYRVGDTGLRFAVGLNNFGFDAEVTGETTRPTNEDESIESDFETVSPPTNFIIGAAYDAWSNSNSKLVLTGQLTKPSDNAERFAIGAEYGFMKQFFFRTGYEFGVEELIWPSVGFGINTSMNGASFIADVSYTAYERLGAMPRFTLKFGF